MALSQASNYRILAGALVLKSFTVNDLSRFSKCLPGTVRTTLYRNREYIGPVSSEPSGKRGGQPLRYRLLPEKEAELESRLKASLPQLPAASVLPDFSAEAIAKPGIRFEPGLGFASPSVFHEYTASAGEEAFSSFVTRPVSLRGRDSGTVRPTQFNELAPSGMLVAEDQLGEMFDAEESSERKRELVEEASESLRAGRAEYESWPAPKKQTSLGLSVASELEKLGHKLQSRTEEVNPELVAHVVIPAHMEQISSIAKDLEAIQMQLQHISKAPRFFGGGFSSSNNRILIDSLVESDVAFPDGDIEIGTAGHVRANISARSVKIRGRIEGNLIASGEVSLLAGSRLHGDITASRISIEDGAIFSGRIDIRKIAISAAGMSEHQADAIEVAKAGYSESESVEAAPAMYQATLRLSSH